MAAMPNYLAPIAEDSVPKVTVTPDTPADTERTTSAYVPQPPTGYKFVKVRKADGSIATVKRKLSPEEASAAGASATTTETQPNNFKIVTVRKADGTLVKVKRSVDSKSEDSPNKAAPQPQVSKTKNIKDDPATTSSDMDSKSPNSEASGEAPVPQPKFVSDAPDIEEALVEQRQYQRARKMQRFKTSLARGLGTVVAGALPSIHIGDFESGDEIMSDSDLSGDDDDLHEMDHDDHHDSHSHDGDNASDREHSNDDAEAHGHFTFDGGAAAGGVASALAATTAQAPNQPPPSYRTAAGGGANGSEKVTFKVTAKELNEIEQQAADKEAQRSLHRHWANFSFYFMASLSIVLPGLFLILSGFIIGMKGKSAYSNWSKMENGIKVAISAWPIVFAAVTAQCFKSWATYKVERGIKLMELEQLVGSNSFGSAMKQPFLLRRLDLLSLFLFGIWCLSPVGSQALQRVYSIKRDVHRDTVPIYYLNMNGNNEIWGPNSTNLNSDKLAESEQIIATDYIANISPDPLTADYDYDRYARPLVTYPASDETLAGYGVPIALPLPNIDYPKDTARERDNPAFETLNFTVTSSYFNFTCGDWSLKLRKELDSNDSMILFGNSETLGLAMTTPYTDGTSSNGIQFASLNKAPQLNRTKDDPNSVVDVDDNWEYSFMECSFEQVFVDTSVSCTRDSETLLATCARVNQSQLTNDANRFQGTDLTDFSFDWLITGSPNTLNVPSTPTEMYLDNTAKQDGFSSFWYDSALNLSSTTTPDMFQTRFGYLFNTWVGLGYCTLCLTIPDSDTMAYYNLTSYYTKQEAVREWSQELIYTISVGWVACFVACTCILLFAGIVSVVVESMTVAPDVLGYVSTVARNSKYLHLPKTNSAMNGGERARQLGGVKVMMQDVKANADIGKIALGLKHENAERLKSGRLYR